MPTIYDHLEQNKRRTVLLVLLFPITFFILVYALLLSFHWLLGTTYAYEQPQVYTYEMGLGELAGATFPAAVEATNQVALRVLPFVLVLAVGWMVTAYYYGDAFLLGAVRGIEIHREDQPEIYNLVENLCIAQGIPVPRIFIINDTALNAFATGRDPEHASIALTKGIVQKLERVELEGVIAHELAHVKNRDIRLMLLTILGIAFFTFLSEMCFRLAVRAGTHAGRNRGRGQIAILFFVFGVLLAVYGYLVAPFIRLAISRTREFQADATAALMTRHPAALARALRKISQEPRAKALEEHTTMAAMCIVNPLAHCGLFAELSGLFSTHPPVEDRIAALQEMDGRI